MTTVQIVYWRDIPAQVKARAGRLRASRQCSDRFQAAIDEAAMRGGVIGTDEYLAEWRTGEPQERPEEPEAAAEAVLAEIDAAFPPGAGKLRALVENFGRAG